MQHHLLNFPDDPEALKQTYQWMFGDNILVAPGKFSMRYFSQTFLVIDPGVSKKHVYLPKTDLKWINVGNFLSYDESDGRFRIGLGEFLNGGQYIDVPAGKQRICELI